VLVTREVKIKKKKKILSNSDFDGQVEINSTMNAILSLPIKMHLDFSI